MLFAAVGDGVGVPGAVGVEPSELGAGGGSVGVHDGAEELLDLGDGVDEVFDGENGVEGELVGGWVGAAEVGGVLVGGVFEVGAAVDGVPPPHSQHDCVASTPPT